MRTRSARSGSRAAMPCGRCARCSAPATRTTCRCSAASRWTSSSRTSICRRCRPASRWSRTIATCISRSRRTLVSFLRGELDRRGILRHELLPGIRNGERVTVAGLVLVRQRPGTAKGVIFMTLEDETGIANTIVWARAFEKFRPIVIGARLVAITGPLQSASGVIHVVMEHIEDLTPLLRRLSEEHGCVDIRAHADQARRPIIERHRHPRAGDSLVTALKEKPTLVDELTAATARVMPKGRNFH